MRAAAIQLNSTEAIDANLEMAEQLVRQAAGLGAEFIVLPEKWNILGRGSVMAEAAEPLDGPSLTLCARLAAELGIDLVAGSIIERLPDTERRANTSVLFGRDGFPRAVYRKLHMFDVEVDGVVYAESAHEQAGGEIVTEALSGGRRLGMSVCYDVRFPELYRALSRRGAEVLSVPAAFTLATTRDHWEVLLRARAIENQCFVVAANQVGPHPPGDRSGGRSMIVDPWGIVLASAPDTENVIVADLDFRVLDDVRKRLPALTHRRPDELYSHGVTAAEAPRQQGPPAEQAAGSPWIVNEQGRQGEPEASSPWVLRQQSSQADHAAHSQGVLPRQDSQSDPGMIGQ